MRCTLSHERERICRALVTPLSPRTPPYPTAPQPAISDRMNDCCLGHWILYNSQHHSFLILSTCQRSTLSDSLSTPRRASDSTFRSKPNSDLWHVEVSRYMDIFGVEALRVEMLRCCGVEAFPTPELLRWPAPTSQPIERKSRQLGDRPTKEVPTAPTA